MAFATVRLAGGEIVCSVTGGDEARFRFEDTAERLKSWARRYDSAASYDNEGELATIGQEMFAWLDSTTGWATTWIEASGDRELEIQVKGRDAGPETVLLDAPWELLLGPAGPLAADDACLFVVSRRVEDRSAPLPAEFGDLSMMFMAASPEGVSDLDYEAEEMAILDATARLRVHVAVEETGALEFLHERLVSGEGPFDILHLSCHGDIDERMGPVLALEDAFGGADLVTPGRIHDCLGQRPPSLLFLSACRTAAFGTEPGSGPPGRRENGHARGAPAAPRLATPLARQMARRVANIIGWDGSVYDSDAVAFAEHFYRALAGASSAPRAAAMARKRLLEAKTAAGGGRHWHLARVYLGARGGGPLCDQRKPARQRPSVPDRLFLDKARQRIPVASRAEFVGRRRAIQALLRAYRGGTFGALVHGMGALGKSSLAARIVSRMPNLMPIVLFERYDATAIFDAVKDTLPPDRRHGESAVWREQIGREGGLAEALESWLDGPLAGKPMLLIVDDLERILETPRPSDEKVGVARDARAPLAAILTAFARAHRDSRLLLTSRYDFKLPDKYGDDLAEPLARIRLTPMTAREQQKQWRAARKLAGREGEVATSDVAALYARALAAAQGNPGLQALLTRPILAGELEAARKAVEQIEVYLRTGAPPEDIAALIAAGQANDRENAVVAFFRRLSFEVYRAALSADQARQMTAAAFFAPSIPIPLPALVAVGAALGVAAAESAVERLIGLGLIGDFGDIAGHRHAALDPLARPLASPPEADEEARLARAAMPGLVAAWRDEAGDFPHDFRGLEAARIALAGHVDTASVEAAVFSAAGFLQLALGETRAAFEWLMRARAELPADHAYGPSFLRLCVECSDALGEAAFQTWAFSAAMRSPSSSAPKAQVPYAIFDLRRAEYLVRIGDIETAHTTIRNALRVLQTAGEVRNVAVAMGQIADILRTRGDLDEALRIRREEELPVFERLGDVRERAVTMGKIADILESRGDLDEALRIRCEEQLPVYDRLGEVRSRAVVMGQIADIVQSRGDLDEALRIRREEELPVYERLGDVRTQAVTMGQIADILQLRGDLDEALRIRREEELPVYDRLGDVRSQAVTMGQIADILQLRGDLDEALRIRRDEELPVFERLGDVRERALAMGRIADALQSRGDFDGALRIRREEELPVYDRLGDVRSRAITISKIADIVQSRGDLNEALRLWREQLPVYERLGDVGSRAVTMGRIADILESLGDLDEALRIRRDEQLPVYERLGFVRERAVTLQRIAGALLASGGIEQGRIQEISEALEESFSITVKLQEPQGIAGVGAQLAQVLMIGDQRESALEVLDRVEAAYEKLGNQKGLAFARQLRADAAKP